VKANLISYQSRQMQPLHILVVDDICDSAETLAMLIGFWGHEVVVAYDGPDALAKASANPPDVVLLDVCLPIMSGLDLARRLRRLPGMAKALLAAISGYGREVDVQRCKEAGIDCHFVKPVDLDELQKVLANAVNLGREQRQLAC
jgi:two-component system CheB/CheR fusion protein